MSTPEWVLVGTRAADGSCIVTASHDLDRATITSTQPMTRVGTGSYTRGPERHRIAVETSHVITAVGDTYPDALRTLFRQWSPDDDSPLLTIEARP